jgi:hypothetical protein
MKTITNDKLGWKEKHTQFAAKREKKPNFGCRYLGNFRKCGHP